MTGDTDGSGRGARRPRVPALPRVRSLRRRLVLATALLTTIGMAALLSLTVVVLTHVVSEDIDGLLNQRAASAASTVVRQGDGIGSAGSAGNLGDVTWIYDAGGRFVAGTTPGNAAGSTPAGQAAGTPELATALAALSSATEPTERETGAWRLRAVPVVLPGETEQVGVVVVAVSLAPYQRTETRTLLVGIGLAVLVVLGVSGMAAWTVRRALRPVEVMAQRASEWSADDLGRRFDLGEPHDELTRLGQVLDGLLARVSRTILAEQRLTAELAHELRTPLTVIRAEAELAGLDPALSPAQADRIGRIVASVDQLTEVIGTLLAVSRGQVDRDDRASVDDVLRAAAAALGSTSGTPAAGATGLVVVPAPGLELGVPQAVALRALAPLLENAVRYCRSRVTVRAGARGGSIEISVTDDGPGLGGIDPELVFTPGYRAQDSPGAGLGLALARRVALAAGGSVAAAPAEDHGRFVLTLPGVPAERHNARPDVPPTRGAAQLPRTGVGIGEGQCDTLQIQHAQTRGPRTADPASPASRATGGNQGRLMTSTEPTAVNERPADELPEAERVALDQVVADLAEGEIRWAATSLGARSALLREVALAVAAQAERWVAVAAQAKGLDPSSQLVGEEWLSGPYVTLTNLATLQNSLSALEHGESPLRNTRFGRAPGGRVTVPVLPGSPFEALLLHGFTAEAWLKPGVTEEEARSRAGLGQRHPSRTGGVGLVLGAGNITSIPPLDVLYELIAHNRVSVLKLNPVLDALRPVYTDAFAPLIEAGVLSIVSGGAAVGGYLAHHDGVAHVHITGSAATHDVVVFGRGAEGRARRAAGTPLLGKPITSELGGVAPIIVLPGTWSRRDLRFQAEHVATQRLHNGGYNCIAGQVVVLSSDWPQKAAFLAALREAVDAAPGRPPWYPGSDARVRDAADAYPAATHLGPGGGRLLIEAGTVDSAALTGIEAFAPVLGVIELPGTGQAFLDAAVTAANADFLGTLGANILGTPHTIRRLGAGFTAALERLRYGTIAVNAWTAVGFLTAAAPWGAFPGHSLSDVQSGIGVVHNALLLDDTERTVVRGPFRPFPRSVWHGEFALFPKPPWFVSARSAARTARLLTEFAARPSWGKAPAIFLSAFRA
jgi:signal transduction histidine kinase/acyl-CoA reductase-like NAD-dependent aldehyde dehydrogenase